MADISATSVAQFQQLRNRQNELQRKNTAEIIEASKAGQTALRNQLLLARVTLQQNDQAIFEAELAFAETNLSQSDAERILVAQTAQANKLVKNINTAAKVLTTISEVAGVLQDLITALR
jgi:hypothetical protein